MTDLERRAAFFTGLSELQQATGYADDEMASQMMEAALELAPQLFAQIVETDDEDDVEEGGLVLVQ